MQSKLLWQAITFKQRLESERSKGASFPWYPYQSLSNLWHIADLLGEPADERLAALIGDEPVLDLGCGDGDVGFFLEGLGHQVDAIDNPVTNHNGMRGVNCLKERLGSRMAITSVDMDEQFWLPRARYGLVLCLGVLYHVRNPYYLLEKLSRSSNYMFLSTRVTSWMPSMNDPVQGISLAYFLTADELNNDNTNYWIMTKECLRRMLKRTHWVIEAARTHRLAERSDPVAAKNDERIFLLLRSRHSLSQVNLVYGWHQPENEGWRWTERRFAVRTPRLEGARHKITLKLYVPPEQQATPETPLTLEAFAEGHSLGKETYTKHGDQSYARALPPSTEDGSTVEFALNRAIEPEESDPRERGVVVAECEVDSF